MKTSEFIKYFRDEGQYAYKFSNSLLVQDEDDYALINLCDDVGIDINIGHLPFEKQQEYYKVIFEYLMTPIEKREEEKKYKLQQKGVSKKYLIWLNELSEYTTGVYPYENENVKTVFTQEEIDNMPECFTHPAVWEQIEVDEND